VLAYGQPDDPDVRGYRSETRRYSMKQWRPVLFDDDDIEADPQITSTVVESAS
jgi:acyl-homoserine-lactone acylase